VTAGTDAALRAENRAIVEAFSASNLDDPGS
jgi:hypothetical protein